MSRRSRLPWTTHEDFIEAPPGTITRFITKAPGAKREFFAVESERRD